MPLGFDIILSMKTLILASSSPSRKGILEQTGIKFEVDPGNYEEDMSLDMSPSELAKFLSLGKASSIVTNHSKSVVLGADSFAVFEGELLGKPHTIDNAKKMLKKLCGQWHEFITGFTIIDCDTHKTYSEVVSTKLLFGEFSDKEIDEYLTKDNVLNLAGAYDIQRLGGVLVKRIEGSYSNIYGLPIFEVAQALKSFGIEFV